MHRAGNLENRHSGKEEVAPWKNWFGAAEGGHESRQSFNAADRCSPESLSEKKRFPSHECLILNNQHRCGEQAGTMADPEVYPKQTYMLGKFLLCSSTPASEDAHTIIAASLPAHIP